MIQAPVQVAKIAGGGAACAALTAVYFLFSDQIIETIFGPAYNLEGPVLGLMGLGMGGAGLASLFGEGK